MNRENKIEVTPSSVNIVNATVGRSISVIMGKDDRYRQFLLKHSCLNNIRNVVIEQTPTKCVIREPSMFDNKTVKLNDVHSGWVNTSIKSQIEIGKYLIDNDESNNSSVVFYLEDRI